MRLDESASVAALRRELREFLAPYRHLGGFMQQGKRWPEVRAFFRAMGERGYLSLTWPKEHGGRGLGLYEEFVLWDEVAYARAARNPLSAGIVAKTLMRHGTDAQKAEWLPAIRSGEQHFSIAYSEPEAGSDLAALRTRAVLRGDCYVIDGHKCWQSYAQDMDYLWLLARTGPEGSRGRGLSLFIVDKRAPGVSVRPIPTMDGEQLNEIFLDGVEVPIERRVGAENGAWPIMNAALADERHIQFPPARVRRDLEDVIALARRIGRLDDPEVRRVLAELSAHVLEVQMLALLVVSAMQRGEMAVVEAAANKVRHTEVCQRIVRAAFDFGGQEALASPELCLLWGVSTYETIGGGTSEIMRGIVAKQGLGLSALG
jgi:alkylation response protein AidB-like acyl-CoA dehydrogenase